MTKENNLLREYWRIHKQQQRAKAKTETDER
jgi:hypothetical protein